MHRGSGGPPMRSELVELILRLGRFAGRRCPERLKPPTRSRSSEAASPGSEQARDIANRSGGPNGSRRATRGRPAHGPTLKIKHPVLHSSSRRGPSSKWAVLRHGSAALSVPLRRLW